MEVHNVDASICKQPHYLSMSVKGSKPKRIYTGTLVLDMDVNRRILKNNFHHGDRTFHSCQLYGVVHGLAVQLHLEIQILLIKSSTVDELVNVLVLDRIKYFLLQKYKVLVDSFMLSFDDFIIGFFNGDAFQIAALKETRGFIVFTVTHLLLKFKGVMGRMNVERLALIVTLHKIYFFFK